MNQEQIQPDYNYILQQQTPDSQQPKKKKLTYVVFAAIVFLIILTLGAVIASSLLVKQNPQPEMIRGHSDAAQQFITSLSEEEYTEIVESQLASNLKLANKVANVALLERFASTTNFASCVSQSNTAQDDGTFTNIYVCDSTSGGTKKQITVSTRSEDGAYKIKGHKIETYAAQN